MMDFSDPMDILPAAFIQHHPNKDPRVPVFDVEKLVRWTKIIYGVTAIIFVFGTIYYWALSTETSTAIIDLYGAEGDTLEFLLYDAYLTCDGKSFWYSSFFIGQGIHAVNLFQDHDGDGLMHISEIDNALDFANATTREVIGYCVYGPGLMSSMALSWSSCSGFLTAAVSLSAFMIGVFKGKGDVQGDPLPTSEEEAGAIELTSTGDPTEHDIIDPGSHDEKQFDQV
jgi:hypothetical protein